MATRIRFVDIYSLFDDADAGIIENLLEDYNISCMVKRFGATPDGLDSGKPAVKRIAVEEDGADNARRIISDAIKTGVISNKGQFEI